MLAIEAPIRTPVRHRRPIGYLPLQRRHVMTNTREPVRLALRKLWSDHVIWTRQYIIAAVDLVGAAKSGDDAAFAQHDKRWSDNVADIARFLSGANSHWPEADVLDMLNLHLKLTKDEAVARLQSDWAADVKAFDDIFTEAMVI